MKFEELLQNTGAITAEEIETQRADLDKKIAIAVESCKAYMEDVDTQNGRIKAKAAKYATELAELETLEKKHGASVAQAVAKGEQSKADAAEAELDKTAEKIAAVKKKCDLMTGATAKGERALYDKAKAAMEAADAAAEEYREHLESLQNAIVQEKQRLEKLAENISNMMSNGFYGRRDFASSARSAFTKVERHYKDLDRKEAEARQKWKEQRKADEAERTRMANVHVLA